MRRAPIRQSLAVLMDNNHYLGDYGAVAQALKQNPLQQFAQEACDETGYTPDTTELFKQRYHLLFAYDGLQRNMPDHDLLEDPVFYGKAYTRSKNFLMFKQKGADGYPIPLLEPFDVDRLPIYGELFVVKAENLVKVDEFKSNTAFHHRVKMRIHLPWKLLSDTNVLSETYNTKKIDAWVYVADGKVFRDKIKNNKGSFDICDQYFTQNSKRHYQFTSEDLELSQGA